MSELAYHKHVWCLHVYRMMLILQRALYQGTYRLPTGSLLLAGITITAEEMIERFRTPRIELMPLALNAPFNCSPGRIAELGLPTLKEILEMIDEVDAHIIEGQLLATQRYEVKSSDHNPSEPIQDLMQHWPLSKDELDWLLLVTMAWVEPNVRRVFKYVMDDVTQQEPPASAYALTLRPHMMASDSLKPVQPGSALRRANFLIGFDKSEGTVAEAQAGESEA